MIERCDWAFKTQVDSSIVTLKKPRDQFPLGKFAFKWTLNTAFKGTKIMLAWMAADWCVPWCKSTWQQMGFTTAARLAAHFPLSFLTRRQMKEAGGCYLCWQLQSSRSVLCCWTWWSCLDEHTSRCLMHHHLFLPLRTWNPHICMGSSQAICVSKREKSHLCSLLPVSWCFLSACACSLNSAAYDKCNKCFVLLVFAKQSKVSIHYILSENTPCILRTLLWSKFVTIL